MLLDLVNNARTIAMVVLEVSVAILAVRHGLFRRLPVFTVYLISVVLVEVIRLSFIADLGVNSKSYFWTYWITQAVLISMRGIVVSEVCRKVLGQNIGIWHLCRIILCGVAGILFANAAIAAWRNQSHITALITTLERDLELAIVGTLIFAFVFTRYYLIRVDRLLALVSAGLVFYSAVQVANHEFISVFRAEFYPSYAVIVVNSFMISMFIWLVAVWKPVPANAPAAAMLGAQTYQQVIPEVNLRLRELNSRLLEILR
ncbi:MAG: hypothetical protein WAK91_12905 [Candidatus Acidiferrales bacterium]|jgi:hypothetical protein